MPARTRMPDGHDDHDIRVTSADRLVLADIWPALVQ